MIRHRQKQDKQNQSESTLIIRFNFLRQLFFYKMQQELVKIGMCALNNDPLNFTKNYNHIYSSILSCKQLGCAIRFGSELQTTGYSCNDHFNEYDTTLHSWDLIGDLIESGVSNGIVCCIGSPVELSGSLYNCQIILFNGKVMGIRPKMALADGNNYFETRWFTYWKTRKQLCDFKLPKRIQKMTGQKTVPMGEFLVEFNDTTLAFQICQEAWNSEYYMIAAALDGAEIFVNPSGSHAERGKMKRKMQMILQNTQKNGGSYCYVNSKGGFGQRTYFDGGLIFCENGKIKSLSELNTVDDVVILPAICNLKAIKTFRLSNPTFTKETYGVKKLPRIYIDTEIANYGGFYSPESLMPKADLQRLLKVYEFPHATYEPSLFLWDYLRKSKASGFFLALSGGLDSCSVALTVYNMCTIVGKEIIEGKKENVLNDLRKIVKNNEYYPKDARDIMKQLMFTCYMATNNSSQETRKRATEIASTLNTNHREVNFHKIYLSFKELAESSLGIELNFKKEGGNWRSDLALQNIQARSRMLLQYLFAQTQLQIGKKEGFLLVLGSSNLDESLRGYFTKYDCSAADFNPIGSFSKLRLKEYLNWNIQQYNFEFINKVLTATPTAELQPLQEGQIAQTDEDDMGLTYKQLQMFGRLRKVEKLGPVSMFDRIHNSGLNLDAENLGIKIKRFFKYYSMNRHKMNVTTPSFHYDPEGCDDNRFDMRPIIYETDWAYQFKILDKRVEEAGKE